MKMVTLRKGKKEKKEEEDDIGSDYNLVIIKAYM
jgi:hypothetical protein